MLLQFDLKHIHKVNFYPSDNNFTQALLVLLVTNMISAPTPRYLVKIGPTNSSMVDPPFPSFRAMRKFFFKGVPSSLT